MPDGEVGRSLPTSPQPESGFRRRGELQPPQAGQSGHLADHGQLALRVRRLERDVTWGAVAVIVHTLVLVGLVLWFLS